MSADEGAAGAAGAPPALAGFRLTLTNISEWLEEDETQALIQENLRASVEKDASAFVAKLVLPFVKGEAAVAPLSLADVAATLMAMQGCVPGRTGPEGPEAPTCL